MDEELNQKFQVYEQQIMQIQEQLRAIEQATLDMSQISFGLDEIPKNKDSEILAPIGRGIFVSAKIISEELTMDVGEGTFVKKSISDTKEIISEQIEKLNQMRKDLENELEKINDEITRTMEESQKPKDTQIKNSSSHKHSHSHDGKCEGSNNHTCDCGHEH